MQVPGACLTSNLAYLVSLRPMRKPAPPKKQNNKTKVDHIQNNGTASTTERHQQSASKPQGTGQQQTDLYRLQEILNKTH